MKLGKAPGLNGLPTAFYSIFKSELIPYIEELLRYCFNHGVLPSSWGQARLALIPRKDKDTKYPDSFRPIAILNADYKILETNLANRLSKVIGSYVNHDQTGFIHGRHLKDNVCKSDENCL